MSFTTYKSSAGSGKTTTLVAEYLTIALSASQPDNYKKILAITFTNKAAHEMKERVINSLKSMAKEAPEDQRYPVIFNKVKQALNLDDNQLKNRASKTLNHILHHYNDFSISTIDSFTHKIIRTFAHDLKLPINFEVDLDNDALLKKSIDLLLSRIGDNPALTSTLVSFSTSKTDDSKSWRIGNDLTDFARLLIKDEYESYLESLRDLNLEDFKNARKAIQQSMKVKEKRWFDRAQDFMNVLAGQGLTYLDLTHGKNGAGSYLNKLFNKNFGELKPSNRLMTALEKNRWHAGSAPKSVQLTIQSIQDELTAIGNEMVADVYDHQSEYALEKELNKYIYQLAVLREIELEMEQYKADNNIMSISEFNKKIAEIVMNEPAPFIYERLGERYQNYLIDEFQDTSESQWKNLLPLLSNALSQGKNDTINFNMVVGDAKQSIYRWRGGDADQFMQLPHVKGAEANPILMEHQQVLARNHQEQVLDSNYRSKREVVEFNNWFFQELIHKMQSPYIKNVYWGNGEQKDQSEEFRQKFREDYTGGYASIEVKNYDDKTEFEAFNLERIHQIIDDCIQDGYQLKDICLLFRTNKTAIQVANDLVNHNVPVMSSETLLLKNDPAVRAITAFFKWALDPKEGLAGAGLISALNRLEPYNFNLHQQLKALAEKTSDKKEVMLEFLNQYGLEGCLEKLQTLSTYEAVQYLTSKLKLGDKPNAYLGAFAQQAHTFSLKTSNHLRDFLEFWKQKRDKLSISIPEGSNAVRIMTIHKSKGLEFPVVIIPFLDWSLNKLGDAKAWVSLDADKYKLPSGLIGLNKSSLENTDWSSLYEEESDKTKLDYINILYVAVTRPVDRLYSIVSQKEGEKNTLSKLICPLLEEHPQWNGEASKLEVGTRTQVKQKSDQKSSASLHLKPTSKSNWREQLQLAVSTPWNQQQDSQEAKAFGEILHHLLSIKGTLEDRLTEMHQLIQSGWINRQLADAIEEQLGEVEGFKPYQDLVNQSQSVWSEREMAHPKFGLLRPDKVFFTEKETVVVDFKTGSYRKKHEEQVRRYADVLTELGFLDVRGVLFYLDQLEWKTLQ